MKRLFLVSSPMFHPTERNDQKIIVVVIIRICFCFVLIIVINLPIHDRTQAKEQKYLSILPSDLHVELKWIVAIKCRYYFVALRLQSEWELILTYLMGKVGEKKQKKL